MNAFDDPPSSTGMKLRQISALKVKPSYGYRHPDCSMPAPVGVPSDETLCFELQPVHWYPAEQVCVGGEGVTCYPAELVWGEAGAEAWGWGRGRCVGHMYMCVGGGGRGEDV